MSHRNPNLSIGPIAVWAVVALGLGAVAALYLQPGFIVTLANQLWTCF